MSYKKTDKSLFLVTSAIYTKFGVYDHNQRLQQTVDSLRSIHQFCNADVILIDAGNYALSENDKNQLSPYLINIVEFNQDSTVKKYQSIDNWDVVKTLLEISILIEIFNWLSSQSKNTMDHYKRIFKLSGRYTLNNNFDYKQHLFADDKITIKKSISSLYDTDHWVIQENCKEYFRQYMTRLWSFDVKLLPYILNTYHTMLHDLLQMISKSRFIDIEHLMYYHLDSKKVQNLEIIGVSGNIAPNGMLIMD